MNEDFVPFELLCKLRNKGYYRKQARYEGHIHDVLKWLREEKNFYVVPLIYSDWSEDADGIICEEWLFWSYRVININDGRIVYDELGKIDNGNFENYEQAALAGIEYVLDNLI